MKENNKNENKNKNDVKEIKDYRKAETTKEEKEWLEKYFTDRTNIKVEGNNIIIEN